MKSFKSHTKNKGTTFILEDCEEAINLVEQFFEKDNFAEKIRENYSHFESEQVKSNFDLCKEAIQKGNKELKELAEQVAEDVLCIVDDIQPIFSKAKQGYERTDGESGIASSSDLLMQGEEMCAFKRKQSEEKIKRGAGEGAYRILINTDVSWWGKPEHNCGLVAALIILLQRYGPVEVWIQQGWLGNSPKDGVTLFKLDYTTAIDISTLAFWICHPGKDVPFSFLVNKALNRRSTITSCVAEIECDLMVRGDWFLKENISHHNLYHMSPFEMSDAIAKWIAKTGYKIVFEEPDINIEDI